MTAPSLEKEDTHMVVQKSDSEDHPLDIIPRPPGQLHDFPIDIRWEVTRRHPYYLAFWEEVRRYRQGQLGDSPEHMLFGYAAALVLGAIGVSGEPVDPALPFSEIIGHEDDPSFLSGSVQPMTLRSVVAMLLTTLPPEERAFVGSLLLNSGAADYKRKTDYFNQTATLDQLRRTPSPALDSFPLAPLFYIHLGASQRTIARDVEDQVRRWKARRELQSNKIHSAKLAEYLKIWDLRTGWSDGRYDRTREHQFDAIARKLKIPISTLFSRYRIAFEFITGHSFKLELWWQIFGPLKFGKLCGEMAGAYAASAFRRINSPVRRPVPDSVLSGGDDGGRKQSTVESARVQKSGIPWTELRLDLLDLIERGQSDEAIAQHLEVDPETIAAFRSMSDELQQISQN